MVMARGDQEDRGIVAGTAVHVMSGSLSANVELDGRSGGAGPDAKRRRKAEYVHPYFNVKKKYVRPYFYAPVDETAPDNDQ
ncbi:MAG TPA: hypothetical protein VGN55_20510 [Xanthobacteraceae bacterium]|jgi:hypothetical protein